MEIRPNEVCDINASKAKVYPLSRNERDEVQEFVEEHLRKGYIRPSKSQQMSPVFFVGKKDGGKQMVMDYHRLNKQTCQDANSKLELSLYSLLALDKENLLEFSCIWSIYLYTIVLVCALLPHALI